MTIRTNVSPEYVEETTFGQAVTDPAMNWFGRVTSYESVQDTDHREFPISPSSNNVTTAYENIEYAENISAEMSYVPQNFDRLKYFLGSSSSVDDSSALPTIQIGEKSDNEYRRLLGCVGESWEMSVSEDSAASVSATFIAADKDSWSTTDYIGAGSHATDPGTNAITYSDISNVQFDGSSFSHHLSGLSVSVDNDIQIIKNNDSSFDSKIFLAMLMERDIEVTLNFAYDSNAFTDIVSNFNKHTITFDINNSQFSFSGVKFPTYNQPQSRSEVPGSELTSLSVETMDVTSI